MYLTPTTNHYACDIEADDLLPGVSQVWCVCLINCVTKEEFEFTTKETFNDWQRLHPDAIYVGHNFITYDAIVLNWLYAAKIPLHRIVDTYVLSQLYNPSYSGGHSLRKWGERLKYPKGESPDFSKFDPAMLTYCRRDTRLTALLFRKLTERMRQVGFTERGAELEHLSWNIIQNRQKKNGFQFDIKKATELYLELSRKLEELQNDIFKLWPPRLEVVGTYKNPYKKDGTESLQFIRHRGQYKDVRVSDDGTYDVIDYVSFNLGSPMQRIEKLLELGWKPTSKTPGGQPKVDEDELLAFAERSGQKEVGLLASWIVCSSRASMVKNWMDSYDDKTEAIHGSLFLAATLRYKHSKPNSANIPGVRHKKVDGEDVALYGQEGSWAYECRSLYTCGDPDEWSLVGIDGKGMQLRCLAHNVAKTVGREAALPFIERVLDGDPHTHNIKTLELANKPAAKKFLYTTLMGGGGAKLASDQLQFGTTMSAAEGNRKKDMLISSVPGFKALIENLQTELRQTGRITLCDGSRVLVSSDHMVIPYLLQGDESRLMKQAMIYVEEEIHKRRLWKYIMKQADIHDEWQYRVKNEVVAEFQDFALPMFPKAGDSFEYLIIIEGDSKVGKTWAETH